MKSVRPHYILAFSADNMGCGFHRMFRPVEILSRTGIIAGRVEMTDVSDEIVKAMEPDVIVFQRACDPVHLNMMDRYRKVLPNAYFVYEIDDILSAIPEQSVHRPYMMPGIDLKLSEALTRVDAVTVTTEDLATHMRTLSDKPVYVVPNMLGKDDLERVDAIKPVPPGPKLRIGWGGGIGHTGDLALLDDAFKHFGDRVTWVFVGMMPKLPPDLDVEFAGAATPDKYLQTLAEQHLDLVLAPLEENQFNRCKSNLRLIEAGACRYPVIASPVGPYLTEKPAVFAYAKTPEEWIRAIEKFLALPVADRAQHGTFMRNWVERRYIMDDHAERRAAAWLRPGTTPFKPKFPKIPVTRSVTRVSTTQELERALQETSDILYVRPGVDLTDAQLGRLRSSTMIGLGSICLMTNDGGAWGFPDQKAFAPIDVPAAKTLDEICAAQCATIKVAAAAGPVVLLRRDALNAVGFPSADDFLEASLMEWSFQAAARGFSAAVYTGAFVQVAGPNPPPAGVVERIMLRIAARWPRQEPNDTEMAAVRRCLELEFYRRSYSQLAPENRQDYTYWAQHLDEFGPRNIAAAKAYTTRDIKICRYGDGPLEEVLDVADDQWVVFLHSNTKHVPEIVAAHLCEHLESNPDSLLVYADHDHIGQGNRVAPDFKPNFDLHLLLGRDYVTQVLAMTGATAKSIARDKPVEVALYRAVLDQAMTDRTKITHIPRVLGHIILPSLPRMTATTVLKVAEAQGATAGTPMKVVVMPMIPIYHSVSYDAGTPPVTIIIPTKNKLEMLGPCLETLRVRTDYPDFEVLIIDNGSTDPAMLEYQAAIDDPRFKVLHWNEPYNWATLNNWAVTQAKHEIVVFLNDDTRVNSPNWLREMVGALHAPNVGAVGARLVYPQGAIQHVGVVVDRALTGHIHKGLPIQHPGNHGLAILSHEATAVTGACLMIRKEHLALVGGLNEAFAHNFNDVALCLDLRKQGLLSIVAAQAELQHFEGITRLPPMTGEGRRLQVAEGELLGKLYPDPDPYWNPNLVLLTLQEGRAIVGLNMDVYMFPVAPRPWKTPESQRKLVLGPIVAAMAEIQDDCPIYEASIEDMELLFVSPPLSNCGSHDLRDLAVIRDTLLRLEITEIIVTELGDQPSILLSTLPRLGIPVTYRPITAEAVCPRRTLKPNGSMCDDGFLHGICQACIDEHGSPRGYINTMAWQAEWLGFLAGVTLDLSPTPQVYAAALRKAFGAE